MTVPRQASVLEMRPLRVAAGRYDVVILGGGLAGLSLAIQTKARRPETSVLVLEKRDGPAPAAAFKVGESTVRMGAHYFDRVVGMGDHLKERHLKKCGLRFIFPAGDNSDITKRVENGPIRWDRHDDWQIDRGVFENELAARAIAAGVELLQGCRVTEVTIGDPHAVEFTQLDQPQSTTARWVVDAAGRASLLKRRLGMGHEVEHTINSSWLRLRGGLDMEQWGAHDAEWMARMTEPGMRMFSTNHLLGEGYWVWMIPLGSGPISIGVCADPRFHPFEEISELDAMLEWLVRHEPQLGEAVAARRGDIEDFLRVEDFAYGVERTISPDRWSLVGEAGAFADPFYSPGSDVIAFGNTATSEVVARDLDGEDVSERIAYYDDLYQRFFAHVLARTVDGYPVFDNPWVLTGKLAWEAFVGHAGMVLAFAQDRLTDLEFMRSVDDDIDRVFRLNIRMQQVFKQWHQLERQVLPPMQVPPFPALIQSIIGISGEYSDDELREALRDNARTAEALAVVFFSKAAQALPDPPPPDARVDPYVVSLDPLRWEGQDGLTFGEANEIAPGALAVWPTLERQG